MEKCPRQKPLFGSLLLLLLVLVGGCHAKQDHSAPVVKVNTNAAVSADTIPTCWLPAGYTVPFGKTVIGPVQSQDDCKFGDFVDVLVGGSDPATQVDSPYVILTNLMVVAGTDAPKDCLPVGTVAVECTLDQRELMQGHGSPSRNWARLHSEAGGNRQEEAQKAVTPRGIQVFRGIEQETVYFNPSNGIAVPRQQEEEK
jgi:hypothetical protein